MKREEEVNETMEQLYGMLMAGPQLPQERPAQKSEPSGKDGFQKLMEEKQGPETQVKPEKAETPEKEPVEAAGQPEEPVQSTAPKSGRELEEQMVLAAMAMMQNPVVPVEQVEAGPVEEVPAVLVESVETAPVVDLEAETPAEVLTPETLPELQTEVPEEAVDAIEVPEEEIPQQVEAPDVPEESEEPEVEIKVETAEPQQSEEDGQDAEGFMDADMGGTPVFKDVEAVPVKVAEAPKAAEAPPVEEQLGPKLSEALQNGETRVELQLTPEHLGKVKVEMTWKEDGSLVVELHAENRSTQSLLEKNASGLEALLGRESQQPVRVEVPRQEESQRQDLYEEQNRQKQHQERQEQRRDQEDSSENFLQQLRLGLIPLEGE